MHVSTTGSHNTFGIVASARELDFIWLRYRTSITTFFSNVECGSTDIVAEIVVRGEFNMRDDGTILNDVVDVDYLSYPAPRYM